MIVYREACKLGCVEAAWLPLSLGAFGALGEGQESKAPAVKREAEENWGR